LHHIGHLAVERRLLLPKDRSNRWRAFERMRTGHDLQRDEIERAWKKVDEQMARIRVEMDLARIEFERALGPGFEALRMARKYRSRLGAWPVRKGRNTPPDGDSDGGEPLPVEPRPKPKPMMGGAEAPVE
jgi:hypothetical protein